MNQTVLKQFVPIENVHRMRVRVCEYNRTKTYMFELVDKRYNVVQEIHLGSDDTKIKSIISKLKRIGVNEKVIEKGIKEFYRRY